MSAPSLDYHRTEFRQPHQPRRGLDGWVDSIDGWLRRHGKTLDELRNDARLVEQAGRSLEGLTDGALRRRLDEFRASFRRSGNNSKPLNIEAMAAIREASSRQLGLRPYEVQLIGALAMNRRFLAEMATGEGKTLTAGLAAILWGWSGRPCFVITVNDYLVQRDVQWLSPLFRFCGVSVGQVVGELDSHQRRMAYGSDITYGTSKEIAADFLRDRLTDGESSRASQRLIRQLAGSKLNGAAPVMRGLHSVIVDEADSVLIDEAVTPLIIAAERENAVLREVVSIASEMVETMKRGVDYRVEPRHREIQLTSQGELKLETFAARFPDTWRALGRRVELAKQALSAREFYLRGKNYVVDDDKIVIVDEATGRQMPQRTWRAGMHQAVEAKEKVSITHPTDTLARISFQRFFRLFTRLAGMTGTGWEASAEFWRVYRLPVVRIPHHRPCQRREEPDAVFACEQEKWNAVVEEVVRVHSTGQPVLIGTRSVGASESLADQLGARGLTVQLLNAVRHHDEAGIIARAGEIGKITVATNMAGRGTDIRLAPGVAALGGLRVVATERFHSSRVDRQFFGRSGRQGDPGSARAFISLDDEIFKIQMSRSLRSGLRYWLRWRTSHATFWVRRLVKASQRQAELNAARAREEVLRQDDWLEESLAFSGSSTAP